MCHLQELFEQLKGKGLVVLGLNASDDRKIALDFMSENGATFPNILDASETAVKVCFRDYRSSGVPLNYIIDRDGKIVDAWYGYEKGHPRAMAALKKTGGELGEAVSEVVTESSDQDSPPR
jgi:peroxiredoxin